MSFALLASAHARARPAAAPLARPLAESIDLPDEWVRAPDEQYEDQMLDDDGDEEVDLTGEEEDGGDKVRCRGATFIGLGSRLKQALETLPVVQPEGISEDRVVQKNSGQVCIICSTLMLEWSVGGMACGHGMCGHCFVGMVRSNIDVGGPLSCPLCRRGQARTSLRNFQMETSCKLGSVSVVVKCKNDGCGATYPLGANQRGESEHRRNCAFESQVCDDCSESVLRAKWATHKIDECSARTYNCTHCKEDIPVVDKADHESTDNEALPCKNLVHCPRSCCPNDDPAVDAKRFKANRERIQNLCEGEIVPPGLLEKMTVCVLNKYTLDAHEAICPLKELECATCGESSLRRDEHQCRSKHIRRKEMQDLKNRLAALEAQAAQNSASAESLRLGVPAGFHPIYKRVHCLTERDLDSRALQIDFLALPNNMEITLKSANRNNGRIIDGRRNGKLKMNLKRNGQGQGDVPDSSQLVVRLSVLQRWLVADLPENISHGFSTKRIEAMSVHHFTFTRAADSTSADVLPLDVFKEDDQNLHNTRNEYGLMLELFGKQA